MRILSVVGARPNFMKVAPLCWALRRWPGFEHLLVHTGQHYDQQMSRSFFHDLDLPVPDINLEVGSGSHAWQTAEVMRRLEPVLLDKVPDVLIVVGDVNSTLAAALTAAKLRIPIAHVEAGLRSFDREMPEEINRQLTDVLSHFLFVTEESGVRNLRREGADPSRVFLVGNVMIDCLLHYRQVTARSAIRQDLGLQTPEGASRPFALLTLHRPSNVDNMDTLGGILRAIQEVAAEMPVLFPIHPRTRNRIEALGYAHSTSGAAAQGLRLLEPMGYLDFLSLMENARIVLTDSGGVQEETTALGVPCLTLRENTERPATVEEGTNQIVGTDPDRIVQAAMALLRAETRSSRRCPPLWDGHAAERIVKILAAHLGVPAAESELAMSPEAGQRV